MPGALVTVHPSRPGQRADLGGARSADAAVVALHIDISNFQQRRIVWMDGRAHPSPNAEHTWMGFSTGVWKGDALVVDTSHVKQMWHRRNGLPQSDKVELVEDSSVMATC